MRTAILSAFLGGLLWCMGFRDAAPDTLSAANGAIAGDSSSPPPVRLLFGGDCLLASSYQDAVGDSLGYAFGGFSMFQEADLSMVNLESPVTRRGKAVPKPYNFRARPGAVRALLEAGIDIVNIANNHIYDYGAQGLFDTILYLDSLGLAHVGAGRNRKEAHSPVIRTIRGIRFGFLGYYGGGEAPGATRNSPGVARRIVPEIAADIRTLREVDSVRVVIVNLHWGTELAEHPDDEQVQCAHDVIDAGADLVIGHHPHVLQGIERYGRGVIVYSLGNLVFGGNARSSYDTGLFEARVWQDSLACRFIPVRLQEWKLTLPDSVAAARIADRVKSLSASFPSSIFNK